MNIGRNVLFRLMAAGLLLLWIGVLPAFADDDDDDDDDIEIKTVKVDCDDDEETIAAALRKASVGKPLVIEVEGTCIETVTITRDDVTLDGRGTAMIDGQGANPEAVLLVDGARRVTIKNLTVRNGSDGILARRGAAVILEGVTAEDNIDDGITVDENSTAQLTDCTAQKNGDDGINVTRNSDATFTGTITSAQNGDEGIQVFADSSALASGATISVNQNVSDGISLFDSSYFFFGGNATVEATGNGRGIAATGNSTVTFLGVSGMIQNNTGNGISLGVQSSLDMRNFEVSGNGGTGVLVFRNSSVQLIGNKINNNVVHGILADQRSVIRMPGDNEVRSNGSGGGAGIFLRSSTLRTGDGSFPTVPITNDISNNKGFAGISADNGSLVQLRAGVMVNNNSGDGVSLAHGTLMRIEGTTVSGNSSGTAIALRFDSSARFLGVTNVIIGGIVCADGESSIDPVGFLGSTCTGF